MAIIVITLFGVAFTFASLVGVLFFGVSFYLVLQFYAVFCGCVAATGLVCFFLMPQDIEQQTSETVGSAA